MESVSAVADVRLKYNDTLITLYEAIDGISVNRPLLATDRPTTENSNQLVHPAGYYLQHDTAIASGGNTVAVNVNYSKY